MAKSVRSCPLGTETHSNGYCRRFSRHSLLFFREDGSRKKPCGTKLRKKSGTGSCKTGRMRRRSERGSNRRTGGPFPVVRQEGLLCFAGSDVLAAVVEAKCAVRGVKASSAFRIGIRRLCTLDSPLCTAGRGPVSFPVRSGLLRSHSRLRARGYKKETAISISRRLVPAFLFLLRRRVPTVFLRVCLRSPPPEPAPCPAGSCCRIRSPVRTAA